MGQARGGATWSFPVPGQGLQSCLPPSTLGRKPHSLASVSSVLLGFLTTLASLRLPRECTRLRPASPDLFPSSASAAAVTCASRGGGGSQKEGGMGGAVPWGHAPTLKAFSHWRRFGSAASDWSMGVASGERKGGLLLEKTGLPGGPRERAPGGGDARAHHSSMTNRLGTAGVRPQDGAGRP